MQFMVPTDRNEKIILAIHFGNPWIKLCLQGVKELYVNNYYVMSHIGESTPLNCWRFIQKKYAAKLILISKFKMQFLPGRVNSVKETIFSIHCLEHSLQHSFFDTFFHFSESNTLQ